GECASNFRSRLTLPGLQVSQPSWVIPKLIGPLMRQQCDSMMPYLNTSDSTAAENKWAAADPLDKAIRSGIRASDSPMRNSYIATATRNECGNQFEPIAKRNGAPNKQRAERRKKSRDESSEGKHNLFTVQVVFKLIFPVLPGRNREVDVAGHG